MRPRADGGPAGSPMDGRVAGGRLGGGPPEARPMPGLVSASMPGLGEPDAAACPARAAMASRRYRARLAAVTAAGPRGEASFRVAGPLAPWRLDRLAGDQSAAADGPSGPAADAASAWYQ